MNQELSANTNLSYYRIVSKLGAGGMGEVWLAEDTRLKRKVALKLLPAELTADAERVRRFEQEAQAASALNHPNIITVHDLGESEAGRFIVMELVAGHTLRTIIAQTITTETVLALGSQIAKALSAAHAAGITHRDIKPDNIMVREDGYVKVLDFGLARLRPATESDSEAATLAQQTTPGTVMGTVAYMSPEQARCAVMFCRGNPASAKPRWSKTSSPNSRPNSNARLRAGVVRSGSPEPKPICRCSKRWKVCSLVVPPSGGMRLTIKPFHKVMTNVTSLYRG